MSNSYEIAVLGGGPGGYVAAIKASQLGFKTCVIEKENLGGICLNWGCIPTKSIIKNAEVYDLIKNHSDDFGISVDNVSFNFEKVVKRSRNVSKKVSKGVEFLLKKNNIDHIKGFGKIKSQNEIDIVDESGKTTQTITFSNLIIATGARPKALPSIPIDKNKIITSSEAMVLKEVPDEIIIIGAGAIGVEFAYIFSVFGSKVTIVEMMDRILPIEDSEISDTLQKSFSKRGIKILTNTSVETAKLKKDKVEVTVVKDKVKEKLNCGYCFKCNWCYR